MKTTKHVITTRYNAKGKRGYMERSNVKAFGREHAAPFRSTIQYQEVRSSDNILFGLNVLKKLYKIHSPSGKEDSMSKYVQSLLTECNIPFTVGAQGEIYSITKGLPVIAAHMDQVQSTPCTCTVQNKNFLYGMCEHKQAGLGADDKNGVWIALNLIKKFGTKINFLFSTMEEVGGMTDGLLHSFGTKITESIPYCIVFDRKGSSDIIAVHNEYCMADFRDAVLKCGLQFGYRETMGIWSDCDHISNHIPCVNLSCGYYMPHSDCEYTNINELINALDFGVQLFSELKDTWFERVQKPKREFIFGSRTGSRTGSQAGSQSTVTSVSLKGKDWEPAEWEGQEWDITGADERYRMDDVMTNGATYIEETLVPFLEDEEYVHSEYMHFDIAQCVDGFYLLTPNEYHLLTDRTELAPGESIEITVSSLFTIFIENDPAYGYDAWITDYASFQGELTYRDGRK